MTMTDTPYFKARPTLYKGIQMRSRTEATVAEIFDGLGFEWQYEPMCFASERGQYLPDFLITDGLTTGAGEGAPTGFRISIPVYVEVKPFRGPPEDVADVRGRMEIIWQSEPDCGLLLLFTNNGSGLFGAQRTWRNVLLKICDECGWIFVSTAHAHDCPWCAHERQRGGADEG